MLFSSIAGPTFANELADPVLDNAGIVSAKIERELNTILRDVHNSGGPQIAVVTLTKLKTGSIEQDSIEMVESLKLGSKEKDDGVLLLIALEDRKMRIEVGQGLEGNLPDIQAGRIIRDTMVPLFRLSRFDEAIYLGVGQILQFAYPDAADKIQGANKPKLRGSWFDFLIGNIEFLIFLMFGFVFFMERLFGRRMVGGRGRGFYHGGGGFGGGGGFSGGGSSGGW